MRSTRTGWMQPDKELTGKSGICVPTGKVKFFDADRGFGFIASDDGQEVFLHASAMPADTPAPKPGTRVEFGVADGRRGLQALSVQVLDPAPSVVRARRRPAEDRKSTRLNSSHVAISYAVFCLKK